MGYGRQPRQENDIKTEERLGSDQIIEDAYQAWPRKLPDIANETTWKSHACFIVAGGTSIHKMNINKLSSRLTIGVNKALIHFRPTLVYCQDVPFVQAISTGKLNHTERYIDLQKMWNEYNGIKVLLSPMNRYDLPDKTVYYVRRLTKPKLMLDLTRGIWGGSNSGLGALMLAVAMGANPIYLLGFDMKARESTHSHGGYADGRTLDGFNHTLSKYIADFAAMAIPLTNAGIQVINLNDERDTDLKCFPIVDPNAVL